MPRITSVVTNAVSRNPVASILATIALASGVVFTIRTDTGTPVMRCAGTGCIVNNLEVSGTLTNAGSPVGGGLSLLTTDARYVRESGDTMTGALIINVLNGNGNTLGLRILNTGSGRHLHAEQILTSSGTIIGVGAITTRNTLSGRLLTVSSNATISGSLTVRRTISGSLVRTPEVSPRIVQSQVYASGATVATGSGRLVWSVPYTMSGYKLGHIHASVLTPGTTGLLTIRARNITKRNRQLLAAPLTIDSGETGSDTAAAAYTIAANPDAGAYDQISFDIIGVHTTPPRGLVLTWYYYK